MIGRTKRTGVPLSGGDITTDVNLQAKSGTGVFDIPNDAHVRRAHPLFSGAGRLMLRRGYSYRAAPDDQGLAFICFQRDLQMFVRTQNSMDGGDRLLDFATTTGSAPSSCSPATTPRPRSCGRLRLALAVGPRSAGRRTVTSRGEERRHRLAGRVGAEQPRRQLAHLLGLASMRASRSRASSALVSRRPCGAPVASSAHIAAAASSRSATGTARVTRPIATASAPLNAAPLRHAYAAARDVSRGSTVSEITAGVRPSLTSVRAKVASVGGHHDVAGRDDADAAGAHRAPDHRDDRLGHRHDVALQPDDRLDADRHAVGEASDRSAPEQNTRSAEVTTTTRTDSSASARSSRSASSVTSWRDRALRLCGRVERDGGHGALDGEVDELGGSGRGVGHVTILPHPPRPIREPSRRRTPPMVTRRAYALYGLLATLVGMAVGHLVGLPAQPRLLTAVRRGLLRRRPRHRRQLRRASRTTRSRSSARTTRSSWSARSWSGVAVLALVAGVLTRHPLRLRRRMLVVLVAIAAAAVIDRPLFEALDLVPSILAALTAVASLWWLHRTARGLPARPARQVHRRGRQGRGRRRRVATEAGPEAEISGKRRATLTRAPSPRTPTTTDGEQVVVIGAHAAEPAQPRPSRRGVLIAGGVLAATAAVFGGAGRLINKIRAKAEDITPPPAAAGEAAPALPMDLRATVPGITPLQVANADFYRVDTRLDTPVVASDAWSLKVTGDVENEFEITFDELLEMDAGRARHHADLRLQQRRRQVRRRRPLARRPLKTIIDRAKPGSGVDQMLATDFDGMTIGTPYDLLTDGREALLAIGMNGEPLPREHGFPARIIVPGLYGFISATKWVTELNFTTYAEKESYWTERDWDTRAPIKPSARIDTPGAWPPSRPARCWSAASPGPRTTRAWPRSSSRSTAASGWTRTAGPDVNNVYWRQWYFRSSTSRRAAHRVRARGRRRRRRPRPTSRPSRSRAAPAASTRSFFTVA